MSEVLKPLSWPPNRRSNDKFVPVLRDSERRLFCVYLVSPLPDYRRVKIGHTDNLSKRLGSLRGLTAMHQQGFALDLFGTLWFQHKDEARAVEVATHKLLAARRCRGGWFEVPVPLAYNAMLIAAKKLDAPYLDYGRYIACCRWRRDLPPERRIAHERSKRELKAVTRRMVEAMQLAAAVHGIRVPRSYRATAGILLSGTQEK